MLNDLKIPQPNLRLHHLHIWALSTQENAMTVHLNVNASYTQEHLAWIHQSIIDRFDVQYITIQIEENDGLEQCRIEKFRPWMW